MTSDRLPVAVIGAGPVGLAAAAHLVARGETPLVLEAGASAAASVRKWGHVRIFSPWRYNVDPAAERPARGARAGCGPPMTSIRPASELVEQYLAPLAALPAIRRTPAPAARASLGVSRLGLDRTKTTGRERRPLRAPRRIGRRRDRRPGQRGDRRVRHLRVAESSRRAMACRPSAKSQLGDRIFYGIPDVLGGRTATATPDGACSWSAAATRPSTRSSTSRPWPKRRPERASSGRSAGHVRPGLRRRPARPARGARDASGSGCASSSSQGVIDIVPGFAISRLEGTPQRRRRSLGRPRADGR